MGNPYRYGVRMSVWTIWITLPWNILFADPITLNLIKRNTLKTLRLVLCGKWTYFKPQVLCRLKIPSDLVDPFKKIPNIARVVDFQSYLINWVHVRLHRRKNIICIPLRTIVLIPYHGMNVTYEYLP